MVDIGERVEHHFKNPLQSHYVLRWNDEQQILEEDWKKERKIALICPSGKNKEIEPLLEQLLVSDTLKSLYLVWNDEQFPLMLLSFTNLQHLGIVNHALTSIPSKINKLKQLRSLLLICTYLIGLPKTIGQLTKLRELYLMLHFVEQLPHAFARLKELNTFILVIRDLYIQKDWQKYYSYPAKWKQTTTSLFELLTNYTQLKKMCIYESAGVGIKLSKGKVAMDANIPSSIGVLEQLEEIDFLFYEAVVFPPEIVELKLLRKIWGRYGRYDMDSLLGHFPNLDLNNSLDDKRHFDV